MQPGTPRLRSALLLGVLGVVALMSTACMYAYHRVPVSRPSTAEGRSAPRAHRPSSPAQVERRHEPHHDGEMRREDSTSEHWYFESEDAERDVETPRGRASEYTTLEHPPGASPDGPDGVRRRADGALLELQAVPALDEEEPRPDVEAPTEPVAPAEEAEEVEERSDEAAEVEGDEAEAGTGRTLTKQNLIDMATAGIAEKNILLLIARSTITFELTAEIVIELQRVGLSDEVVEALISRSNEQDAGR